MSGRQLLACPSCCYGKTRHTHTFATYRVYSRKMTLTLKCKTCGYEQRFKYIEGGTPNE